MTNGLGEKGEIEQNNGELRLVTLDSLPPGNKFCPTDEEVLHYLRMKVHRQPLPPNRIVELNLYAQLPEQLAVSCKPLGDNEWYYFTPRERKYTNGQRPKRSIGDGHGYWKATGAEKDVINSENTKIGYKRALVFYQGKHPHGVKTDWLMHEFRLATDPPPTTDSNLGNIKPFDDYVLCKVYKKNGGETGRKRSRDELNRNKASASSPKIPKLHLGPTQATSDPFMADGELESPDYPFANISQGLLQNQPQPPVSIIQIPQVSTACAVFPPPAAADASLYRGFGSGWGESLAATTMNETENAAVGNEMAYGEDYRTGYDYQCRAVNNFPNYGFQFRQEPQQQHQIQQQLQQAGYHDQYRRPVNNFSNYGFLHQQEQQQQQQPVAPQNHLQVLPPAAPPAGGEFSWHGPNDYPVQNMPSTQRDNPNPCLDNQFLFPRSQLIVHNSYPPCSAPAAYNSQQQPEAVPPRPPSSSSHGGRM